MNESAKQIISNHLKHPYSFKHIIDISDKVSDAKKAIPYHRQGLFIPNKTMTIYTLEYRTEIEEYHDTVPYMDRKMGGR